MILYFEAHQGASFVMPDEKETLKMLWRRAALITMLLIAHTLCSNRPVNTQIAPLELTELRKPNTNIDCAGLSSGDIVRGLWANPTWLDAVPKEKLIKAAQISQRLAALTDDLSLHQYNLQTKLVEMFNEGL